jgi:sulfur carrier protein ThiS
MEIRRNPFKIHFESNKPKTPFDLLGKRSHEPQARTKINATPQKTTKFFDLLKSNDISRTSEFALDLNSQAIKKQKHDQVQHDEDEDYDDEDEDKENVLGTDHRFLLPLLERRVLLRSPKMRLYLTRFHWIGASRQKLRLYQSFLLTGFS